MFKGLKYFALLVMLSCLPAFAGHIYYEGDYQKIWCDSHNGEQEYTLPDRARVDCMCNIDNIDYAVEFDFCRGAKVYEAIGQSLYYAVSTGRKAGAVLIIEDEKDKFYLQRFKKVADKYDIKYWIMTPDDMPKDYPTKEQQRKIRN